MPAANVEADSPTDQQGAGRLGHDGGVEGMVVVRVDRNHGVEAADTDAGGRADSMRSRSGATLPSATS